VQRAPEPPETSSPRKLTELPDSVSGLVALETLAVNDNKIGPTLPETIFGLVNCTAIDLSDNSLAALPSRIGQLPALRHLWLARNRLESLPDSLGRLGSLETLLLHDNKIEKLPEYLGGLTRLRALTLSKNKLTAIPATFRTMTTLERLTLDRNAAMVTFPEQGLGLTQFAALSALSVDSLLFDGMDPQAREWLKAHVRDLKFSKSSLSRSKLQAHIFGEFANKTKAKLPGVKKGGPEFNLKM
jgi:hypothetical protein